MHGTGKGTYENGKGRRCGCPATAGDHLLLGLFNEVWRYHAQASDAYLCVVCRGIGRSCSKVLPTYISKGRKKDREIRAWNYPR